MVANMAMVMVKMSRNGGNYNKPYINFDLSSARGCQLYQEPLGHYIEEGQR